MNSGGNRGRGDLQARGSAGGCRPERVGGLGQAWERNGGTSGEEWWVGESPPGGRKFGLSLPKAFSLFLHLARRFWNQT